MTPRAAPPHTDDEPEVLDYRTAPRSFEELAVPPVAVRRYLGAWVATYVLASAACGVYLTVVAVSAYSGYQTPGYPVLPPLILGVIAPSVAWLGGRAALRSVQAAAEPRRILLMGRFPRWPLFIVAICIARLLTRGDDYPFQSRRMDYDALFMWTTLLEAVALAAYTAGRVGMVQRARRGYLFSGPVRWWTGARPVQASPGRGALEVVARLESGSTLRLRATAPLATLTTPRHPSAPPDPASVANAAETAARLHIATWSAGAAAALALLALTFTDAAERIDIASDRTLLPLSALAIVAMPMLAWWLARRVVVQFAPVPQGVETWPLTGTVPWGAMAVALAIGTAGWLVARAMPADSPWRHAGGMAAAGVTAWWAARSIRARTRRVAMLAIEELEEGATRWWLHRPGQTPRSLRLQDVCLDEGASTLQVEGDPAPWVVLYDLEGLSRALDQLRMPASASVRRD
jgi:hypothetical protein